MPEVGGSRLAGQFSDLMKDMSASIDAAAKKVKDAAAEFKEEVTTGADQAAKKLRAEAADVRAGFDALLGSNREPVETKTADTTVKTESDQKTG